MKEVSDILGFWETHRGEPLALATLVATRGSSFRREGARMLIRADGRHVGGVSAGCIEEEVVECARGVLSGNRPRLLTFDTRRRFGGHGSIDIFVEQVDDAVMEHWRDRMRRRESVLLETDHQTGTRIAGPDPSPQSFVQTIEPPLRIGLVGDGSELRALEALTPHLGWEVLRVDPAELGSFQCDARTAVLLATHNYGRDAAALRVLFPMGLRYLGMIGSRKRRDDLLFDVMHDAPAIDSDLYAPAGLNLGGESPEEIALSIIAEIQSVFAAAGAGHLRDRSQPIHHREPEIAPCLESAA